MFFFGVVFYQSKLLLSTLEDEYCPSKITRWPEAILVMAGWLVRRATLSVWKSERQMTKRV